LISSKKIKVAAVRRQPPERKRKSITGMLPIKERKKGAAVSRPRSWGRACGVTPHRNPRFGKERGVPEREGGVGVDYEKRKNKILPVRPHSTRKEGRSRRPNRKGKGRGKGVSSILCERKSVL